MTLISDTDALAAFCRGQADATYLTVDTEFLRERTFWPKLCLVQVGGIDEAVAVDTLAPGLDLAPLTELLANPKILKVFHAARQDIEIFVHMTGLVPAPLFDTQVAAMVCGFGESVAYDTLVSRLAGKHIDKSSRFTDWSNRPLTDRQVAYALDDVIHLRKVYEKLNQRLVESGRLPWLNEEMATLTDPATYRTEPLEAWRRLKPRNPKPRQLAVLRETAAWREEAAQRRDTPRNWVLRDEALMEIAAHAPRNVTELARVRGLSKGLAEGRDGTEILAAVERARALPDEECPKPEKRADLPSGLGPVVELLKVMLRMRCDAEGVAAKLVASAADLERIAADDEAEVPALHGWRHALFGADALALKHGRIALAIDGRSLRTIPLAQGAATDDTAAA